MQHRPQLSAPIGLFTPEQPHAGIAELASGDQVIEDELEQVGRQPVKVLQEAAFVVLATVTADLSKPSLWRPCKHGPESNSHMHYFHARVSDSASLLNKPQPSHLWREAVDAGDDCLGHQLQQRFDGRGLRLR